jgi:hypothetical protein
MYTQNKYVNYIRVQNSFKFIEILIITVIYIIL